MSNSESQNGEREYIYNGIVEYCEKYNIPRENLLDILEDQKVIPMIRGKATEFIGAAVLRKTLDHRDWDVQKLNLNVQSGQSDEDISVTFRRTGRRFKTETKNAVRGSFRLATRLAKQPHFKVKCHKSRSHLQKVKNNSYEADHFDILLCNVSNAIIKPKALERGLPLIPNEEAISWLRDFYGVADDDGLRRASYDDWRICFPSAIAEDGFLPRTPLVLMENDPHWFGLADLPNKMLSLIEKM